MCEALQISIEESMKAETTTIGGLLCNLVSNCFLFIFIPNYFSLRVHSIV